MTTEIDLNADLGEGVGDDAAMLDVVTSANVACGGHAGDAASMREVCAAALARGVRLGAHVSYVDRAGFGRQVQQVDEVTLTQQLRQQCDELRAAALAVGAAVTYVKPHGALYHAAATDPATARAVVTVAVERGLAVVGLPGSLVLDRAASAGLAVVPESFADRAYTAAGGLAPRGEPGAVLHDVDEIAARVLRLVQQGRVRALDGSDVAVGSRSVCVHGDTPGAVTIARAVRTKLESAGVRLRAVT